MWSSMKLIFIVALQVLYVSAGKDTGCSPVRFNHDSVMCVCNSTHCDRSYPALPKQKHYLSITSNRDGLRFKKHVGKINSFNGTSEDCVNIYLDIHKERLVLSVDRDTKYQRMIGFGAGFTDSAGYVMSRLSPRVQEELLRSLYSKSGLGYNMGRVPIGGTDFSSRPYTYDDCAGDDAELKHFALQPEDFYYKIPYVKWASILSSDDLLLTAAVWSPPLFMKNVKAFLGKNHLLKKYYGSYAKYHIRFLEEYAKRGINFWSITPGNEVTFGQYTSSQESNNCGWMADNLGEFIELHLGPILKNSRFNSTKLLVLDDSRVAATMFLKTMLSVEGVEEYMDGLALHGYFDRYVNGKIIDEFAQKHPGSIVVCTEFCIGPDDDEKVKLGEWTNAEIYASSIIDNFNHASSAYIDWNFVLDLTGGPTYTGNSVDALILADVENDRFYKQTSYYAMGQLSKYVPRGSYRIHLQEKTRSGMQHVAFRRPDGYIAVVLHNSNNNTVKTTILDREAGQMELELTPKSITTVLY